jgi:HAD superfamily hydrolase (TIGR01509 family)
VTLKAIFWDNDGVLVDTERLYYRSTRETLARVGVDLDEALFARLFLKESRGAWHLATEKGVSTDTVDRLRNERDNLYSSLLQTETEVCPGVRESLELLKGRFTMGVATSSKREHFEKAHRHTALLGYFNFVLTAEDCTRTKPDPELYILARERSGFRDEECVAIEDSERGLIAAHAAGIRCWVIPNRMTRSSDFSLADRVFRSVSEAAALASSWINEIHQPTDCGTSR